LPYELLYGCRFGKTTDRHGRADLENEARRRGKEVREDKRRSVPPGRNPVRTWPVAGCPGYVRQPRSDRRAADGGEGPPA
jgi:hypothetical protein